MSTGSIGGAWSLKTVGIWDGTHDHFPGCNDKSVEVMDDDGKKTRTAQTSLF